jgi:hypothetical protein
MKRLLGIVLKEKKSLLAGILVNLLSQIVVEILEKTNTIYSVVFGISLFILIIVLALVSDDEK